MVTPVPEVEEILATLGETPLAWLAAEARGAIETLPELRETAAGTEVEAVTMQLRAIEEAVLEPLRRELIATERIGVLAEELELSPQVELLVEDGEALRRIVLNSEGRRVALETFTETLDRALVQAREQAAVRARRGS